MKYATKAISVAVIISVVCVFATARAGAGVLPKTAKLVPPETILLVDIDDFNQLKKQFEKTNVYKLYKDPAMAAFINDAKEKWREKIREPDNAVVEAIVDANVLPQGRVAAALVPNKQAIDTNEPIAVFITQWGENTTKIKEAVDKIVKKAVENGSHQRDEDYRGVSIKTIIAEDSSRLGYGFSSTLSYCFVDDCFIGSEDIDVLKFVIAHIKGASSPTLADDTDYTSTMKTIGPYHDIDFYVNIKQIIKTTLAEDTTNKTQMTIANLGLDNVTSVGCSIGLARRPGSSYCGKVFLKIEGRKKGICRMLDIESAVLRAARFIPASAHSVIFLNLNIKKAYDELYNILYSFNPMTAAMMHIPLLPPSPDGEPGLELKKDIIDHLGSQIIIAQSINKPFSTDSTPTETFVALAVNNHSALEKSLSLLHSKVIAPNNPDARRELLGHTIYLVTMQGLPFFRPGPTPMQVPAEPGAPQTPTLAFTITDTYLIAGVESTVEQAIRTLSSAEAVSVGSAKWFASAKLAIPSVVGIAALEDSAASGELFWWMIKESGKAKASTVPMGPASFQLSPHKIGELVNFNLLPEFDTVRKYFGSSVFYGTSRPDGFFFEFNYLNPPGTD